MYCTHLGQRKLERVAWKLRHVVVYIDDFDVHLDDGEVLGRENLDGQADHTFVEVGTQRVSVHDFGCRHEAGLLVDVEQMVVRRTGEREGVDQL